MSTADVNSVTSAGWLQSALPRLTACPPGTVLQSGPPGDWSSVLALPQSLAVLGDPKHVLCLLCASVSLFVQRGSLPGWCHGSGLELPNPQPSLFLLFPKDAGGGDSCTSEEEPTFDPGYEPDWAVISTVRPRPRHSEPTRGRPRWCPWGQVVTHLTLSGYGSMGFSAHCQDGCPALASQLQESRWAGCGADCRRPRSHLASGSGACRLAPSARPPDWLWAPPRESRLWR